MSLYDEPGLQDASVSDFLLPYLMGNVPNAASNVASGASDLTGILKGLGNAGEVSLGAAQRATPDISAMLKGLTTPAELGEVLAAKGQATFGPELVNELEEKLVDAAPKSTVTLSDGSKWMLHGIQKGYGKVAANPLLEYVSGPKPSFMKGLTTTTSLSALKEATGL